MTMNFPRLRAAILRHPWAITDDWLEAIAEVVGRRAEGIRLSAEEISQIKGRRTPNGVALAFPVVGLDAAIDALDGGGPNDLHARSPAPQAGDPSAQGSVIAVINIMGIIAQHASIIDDISGPGGTATERVSQSFRQAMSDPAVKAVVLNFDSPGGNVHGVQALAEEIFKARGRKPIVAQVNSMAASAAYWIATAADEIVMTPGAQAGSIGVYALHEDVSKAAEMAGLKYTFVSAGKYKVEGNPFEPLDQEAASAIQKMVNSYYADFTRGVSKGRGVAINDVRSGFGEGRIVKDTDAVSMGMADRVGTLDDTLRRLASTKPAAAAATASAESTAQTTDAILAGDIETLRAAPPLAPSGDVEVLAAERLAAAERDAFRRRRHAHRMRRV